MQPRRSAAQWRKIFDKFDRSGMTQEHFCQREGFARATFCRWQRKLKASSLATRPATFVEVCLASQSEPDQAPRNEPAEEVVVELPFGVVLRFRGFRA
jgi:hypothetical protein